MPFITNRNAFCSVPFVRLAVFVFASFFHVFQTLYNLESLSPCLYLISLILSFYRHPHDFVFPERSSLLDTFVNFPHSHLHFQSIWRSLVLPFCSMTSNRPNVIPVKSLNLYIAILFCWSHICSAVLAEVRYFLRPPRILL